MKLRKKSLRLLSLPALVPVRSLLHLLLTDEDAARLLRVGRTVAASLVSGYTFTQHVFEPVDVEAIWRLKALYEAYGMRPTRMCLPSEVKGLSLEAGAGRSPFPSSLTSLLLGLLDRDEDGGVASNGIFGPHSVLTDSIQCLWTHPRSESLDEQCRDLLMEEWSAPVASYVQYVKSKGQAKYSLPPGLLPHGLRRLQLDYTLTSPLQAGSIPSTVEVLQLSGNIKTPLSAMHWPSSLVHLVLQGQLQLPLATGVLPASLQRLLLTYKHPLAVGVLPSSLRALELTDFEWPIEPHALPSGLTHLRRGEINCPLTVDSLPSSLVSLILGESFRQPLLPHVLPSSLRMFCHSPCAPHPLQPGVLPEGLAVLRWRLHDWRPLAHPLLPGVLPSSLRVLDMGSEWMGDIAAGAVPDGVKWLCLPVRMRGVVEQHLPAGARVEW